MFNSVTNYSVRKYLLHFITNSLIKNNLKSNNRSLSKLSRNRREGRSTTGEIAVKREKAQLTKWCITQWTVSSLFNYFVNSLHKIKRIHNSVEGTLNPFIQFCTDIISQTQIIQKEKTQWQQTTLSHSHQLSLPDF